MAIFHEVKVSKNIAQESNYLAAVCLPTLYTPVLMKYRYSYVSSTGEL